MITATVKMVPVHLLSSHPSLSSTKVTLIDVMALCPHLTFQIDLRLTPLA
jgi:hypothetical protein